MQTAEPLAAEPSAFEVETVNEKLNIHKLPGADQIPAELIKAGDRKFILRSTKLFILFGIRRNCLRNGSIRSLDLCKLSIKW
jgi:hypothetical protein